MVMVRIIVVILVFLVFVACPKGNRGKSKSSQYEFKGIPDEANVGLDSLLEGKGIFVDRINGYYTKIYPDWQFKVVSGVFYAYHNNGYVGFVGFAHSDLQRTLKSLLRDIKPYTIGSTEIYLKEDKDVKKIWIKNIRFPRKLTINDFKGKYAALVVLTGGNKYTRISAIIYPIKHDTLLVNQLRNIISNYHVLPPSERVRFTIDSIVDPSGITAMYIVVPEGYTFSGKTLKIGTAWGVSYKVENDTLDEFMSLELGNFESAHIGYTAFTLYNINGIRGQTPGFFKAQSPKGCKSLVLNTFWKGKWEVVNWKYRRMKTPKVFIPGGYLKAYNITIKARKGDILRYGIATCFFTTSNQMGVLPTVYSGGLVVLITVQMPKHREVEFSRLAVSLWNSMYFNPEWVKISRQRFLAENRILNAMTHQIIQQRRREAEAFRNYLESTREVGEIWSETLQEGNEFVSDMNTAWANILGEQVFTRDPTTGEVYHLDDYSGEFFRDPDLGTIIQVPSYDYDFQNELLDLGWRKMERSFWEFK